MTKEQIDQAFEGRWRIKAESHSEAWIKGVKELCYDFFKTGILLSDKATVPEVSTSGQEEPTVVITSLFETWWNLYQKKRGKEKCMKKWAKLSQKDKQACIAATPAYVASTPDVTYRKDPYTYLNNSSWNDEIYFRNGTNEPPKQSAGEKLADILVG